MFLFSLFFLLYFATMVLTTTPQVQMVPKRVIIYSKKGKSKSFNPTYRLINKDIDKEQELTYIPLGATTPTTSARVTMGTT